MISKNQIKLINSLSVKKFRDETELFVAEGSKLVLELLSAYECSKLYATDEWLRSVALPAHIQPERVDEQELKKISNQKTPQGVLAVFRKNNWSFDSESLQNELCLALDDVQDPGNLGTIIRIADWFGIKNIFCSKSTADAFAPKTVQATMGALSRVKVHYVDLLDFFEQLPAGFPIYGTLMDGRNIYTEQLTRHGLIVMGNEGKGISKALEQKLTKGLLIPNFPVGSLSSESLNVGVATALVCAEFRRRLS